ncbi:hypothetical protein B0H13DRAFT_1897163 [Mycena leptocephala]|nr:hypothetical protein B0H13DRAFT_1897163 [Mycena leptocephala]
MSEIAALGSPWWYSNPRGGKQQQSARKAQDRDTLQSVSMGKPQRAKDQPRTDLLLGRSREVEFPGLGPVTGSKLGEELMQMVANNNPGIFPEESDVSGASSSPGETPLDACAWRIDDNGRSKIKDCGDAFRMAEYEVAPKSESKPRTGTSAMFYELQQAVHRGKFTGKHRGSIHTAKACLLRQRVTYRDNPEEYQTEGTTEQHEWLSNRQPIVIGGACSPSLLAEADFLVAVQVPKGFSSRKPSEVFEEFSLTQVHPWRPVRKENEHHA